MLVAVVLLDEFISVRSMPNLEGAGYTNIFH